jgi:putative transposase
MPVCSPADAETHTNLDREWICSGRIWPVHFCPVRRCCPLRTRTYCAPSNPQYTLARAIFVSVCKDFAVELVVFDGEDDHVHLRVNYPPRLLCRRWSIASKASSRLVRKKNYPGMRKKRWGGVLWSPSYFAGSCGGAPIAVIRPYIEQQQTPH